MAAEKGDDITTELQTLSEDGSGFRSEKQVSAAYGEAVGVYGNIATAEELGYVHRGYVSPSLHLNAMLTPS
jgi:hypothetical protein